MLVDAGIGGAARVVDDHFEVMAVSQIDPTNHWMDGKEFAIDKGGVYLDLMFRSNSIRLTDEQLHQHPAWWGLPEGHTPLKGLLGARLVSAEGKQGGMILLSHPKAGEFTEEDENLLSQLAAMASLSLQHIESRQMAEQAAEDAHISSEHAWRTTAQMEVLLDALPVAVLLADETGKIIRKNARADEIWSGRAPVPINLAWPSEFEAYQVTTGKRLLPEDWPLKRALSTGQNVVGETLQIKRVDGSTGYILSSASPVYDSSHTLIGAAAVSLDITEQRSLQIKQSEQEIRVEVQHRLMEQREEERMKIARDLHDGPLQELIAADYQLVEARNLIDVEERTAKLNQVLEIMQGAMHSLRSFCNELRPPALAPFGFERAIRSHAGLFRERYPDIQLHLEMMPDGTKLKEDLRMTLFQISQELLNNAGRHSKANRVSLLFWFDDTEVRLEVADDGNGFTPPANWVSLARQGHLGLVGLRERVVAAGGALAFQSEPGKGTQVKVTIPLR